MTRKELLEKIIAQGGECTGIACHVCPVGPSPNCVYEHAKVLETAKKFYAEDHPQSEESEIKPIDWEQVRIDAAIAAMNGELAAQAGAAGVYPVEYSGVLATLSVARADALVRKLRGET